MATNQQKQQGDNKDAPPQKVKSEVQKVESSSTNLASLVHGKTNRDPKSPEEQHAQATPEHKEDMDRDTQGHTK